MLKFIFGSNTKSVRVFNCSVSLLWFWLLILHLTQNINIDIPEKMLNNIASQLIFFGLSVFFSVFSLTIDNGYRRRLFKVTSLLLGSLAQSITAVYYITIYPPLDLMLIVCVSFALWFLLAVLYVLKYEGIKNAKK